MMWFGTLALFAFLSGLKFDPVAFKGGAFCRREGELIIVDVDNVRGKSGFVLSQRELIDSMSMWTKVCQLSGQVIMVVDHGTEPSTFYLDDKCLAICFSGQKKKADDVIAEIVGIVGEDSRVVVVTADGGLIDRCKRSTLRNGLAILSPHELLDDLNRVGIAAPNRDELTPPINEKYSSTLANLDYEIRVGAELLQAEAFLRVNSGVNNKRRKKLKEKIRMLREKLARNGPSMLNRVTDVISNGRQSELLSDLGQAEQDALLSLWEKVRLSSNRKERTGDRVILAESLRRELDENYVSLGRTDWTSFSNLALSPLMAQVLRVRNEANHKHKPFLSSIDECITLVVVSDTHGFESSLTQNGKALPEGDVLIHLGDFAIDHGPKKEALNNFDLWLSNQMHPTKIIVRGNHDPKSWVPLESNAMYITKPTTLSIGDFDFGFVPHAGGAISNRMIPRHCDILATHVPPHNILDECISGRHAGSASLRRGVERMKGRPPTLWICGHIHEGRGAIRYRLVGEDETLVVNASNANPGPATRIEHGPVVLKLKRDKESARGKMIVDIALMDNQYGFLNRKSESFFNGREDFGVRRRMLLAVDLGLRTGFSLFCDEGRLLRYEYFAFESIEDLRSGAKRCLSEWEDHASNGFEVKHKITHVAIEGSDVDLRNVWMEVSGTRDVLFVKPEEWRADLLIVKEKLSGDKAKEAARSIARQIVADYGGTIHEGKFKTDVAESVLLGYHVSRRLGWISRQPCVRRYNNGAIIIPETPSIRAANVALSF